MKRLDWPLIAAAPQPAFASAGAGDQMRDTHMLFAQGTGGSKPDDDTVVVQRRRKTESQPGGRQRAEAPQRQREGGSPPPSGGGGTGGGGMSSGGRPRVPGGQSPGGCAGLIVGAIVLILGAIFGIPMAINDNGEVTVQQAAQQSAEQAPAMESLEETTPLAAAPTVPPPTTAPAAAAAAATTADSSAGATAGQTWTIMLYQDADDKVLEQDIFVDFNEAERVGSTDRVNIVAQIDRYRGGYSGDGDWSDTRRYYVTKDGDLERTGSQLLAKGESNMADGATLVDFIKWSAENYPADKYVLILSDHGMGWPGGWSDPDPQGRGDNSSPLSQRLGNQMYLMEIDAALEEARQVTGIDKFEMIGMDACLMAHIEVFAALAPHARYAVASQETEPALGWAYTSFLTDLVADPDITGRELSAHIVDSYITEDQRILDDQARAAMYSRGSPMGGFFSATSGPTAEQVAAQMGQDITLTAADLSTMPALNQAVNNFAYAMQGVNQKAIAQARSYAQSYTSIFGAEVPASYIDIGHFAAILKQAGASGALGQAVDEVLGAIQNTVVAEKHGPNKPGSTGVSIYFPTSQLYRNPVAGPQSYNVLAERFVQESLWDEFLAFHYTGQDFDVATRSAAAPAAGVATRAPGAGVIEIDPLQLSSDTAAPGRPITLNTRVRGDSIGYLYIFTGYIDQDSNSIFVADKDYLESSDTQEVSGVYYPVWPEDGDFGVQFEWEPLVFAISDGTNSELALFKPETYGATDDQATYTVDGIYGFADGSEPRNARLYFRDGVMQSAFTFTGDGETGAPREVHPQTGDTFTITETWMDVEQDGQITNATQNGGTLTFGDQPLVWEELDAAVGQYVVGIIAEDLDGNSTASYAQVTVE